MPEDDDGELPGDPDSECDNPDEWRDYDDNG